MTETTATLTVPRRIYYGWVIVGVAALAMVGTLPGRTQGLGLITEPLLADLGIGRVAYAQVNLFATLVGALFAYGVGSLLDRRGSRVVLTAIAILLGLVVLAMSQVSGVAAAARGRHLHSRPRPDGALDRQPGDGGQVVPAALDVGDGRLLPRDEHRLHDRVPHRRRRGAGPRVAIGLGGDRPRARGRTGANGLDAGAGDAGHDRRGHGR